MLRWFWIFWGVLSVLRRFYKLCVFRAASAFLCIFFVLRSFLVDKVASSSFTDFGALDSLAALQGLFCISVRVALVWTHSASASAVSFFLLLQVGLLAIFATMSFWIFSWMARHLFFSALLRFGFWGLCCADSNKQHGLTCFPVVVPPQGFLFLSSCLL